jgi:hypothetical protein
MLHSMRLPSKWIRAEQLWWFGFTLLQLGRVRESKKVSQELEPFGD